MSRSELLRLAFPLIKIHGFTRDALSRSVLSLPNRQLQEPLSDTAVSALFGHGNQALRTLINAWLDDGIQNMEGKTAKELLQGRLRKNEDVLGHLPEAFALLASPESGLPPLDPRPALKHGMKVADQVCFLTGDTTVRNEWYTRRISLAAIYSAAELHQLTSPQTTYVFLDSLLDSSSLAKKALDEGVLYGDYIFKSWRGIFRSRDFGL